MRLYDEHLFTTERCLGAFRHPDELGLEPQRGQTRVDLRLDLAACDRIPGSIGAAIVELVSDRGLICKRTAFSSISHPPIPAGATRSHTLRGVHWPIRARWVRLEVELLGAQLAFVHATIEALNVGAGQPRAPRARNLRAGLFEEGLKEWPVLASLRPRLLRELQELAQARGLSGATRAQFLRVDLPGHEDRAELLEALRDLPILVIDELVEDVTSAGAIAAGA